MNNDVMFSSKTDLWETPQEFFDELDREFHFDLDVCATPENAKCSPYYTPEQDGLSQPWTGVCWCNPPYGRKIGDWVRKGFLASAEGGGDRSYALTSEDGHKVVSQIHLWPCGSAIHQGSVEIWREQKQCSISEYGRDF